MDAPRPFHLPKIQELPRNICSCLCFPTSSRVSCFIPHISSRRRRRKEKIFPLFLPFFPQHEKNPLTGVDNFSGLACAKIAWQRKSVALTCQQGSWHLWLKCIFRGVFFFYASIMYLLAVRYTPNEYRYVGYIPTKEHSSPCSQVENLLSTGLCTFNAWLSPASNISLKKKKKKISSSGTQSGARGYSKF